MRWKKWLKRVLVLVVLSILARTVWLIGEREWIRTEGNRELAGAVAATESADPMWTWESVSGARRIPPSGRNAAELIPRIKALLPADWDRGEKPKEWEPTWPAQSPNSSLPPEVIARAREELSRADQAVRLARSLKDFPDGNRPIELAPDVLSTKLQDTNDTRIVSLLLRWDAVLASGEGDADRAADDLLALLNVSRSVGDEPFLISQLVRLATRSIASRTVGWVLGQIELSESQITPLQTAWSKDAEEPLLLYGLRGERAAYDVLLRNLADGTVTPDTVAGRKAPSNPSFGGYAWWLYRGRFPRERAAYHRWMSRAVDAARLPVEEQKAALAALPPPPSEDMLFAHLLYPAVEKVSAAHRRNIAEARCVVVALACERFRLRNGGWPDRLSDLPEEILQTVPLDPFNAEPLRYRVLGDGIVIYSVGMNGSDDGGATPRFGDPIGEDEGVRLWDPSERGVPPSKK